MKSTLVRCGFVVLAVMTLGACGGGGDSPSTPTATPTPTPPQTTVVLQDGAALPAPTATAVAAFTKFFTTSATGRLDVSVDWTYASNDLNFVVFQGNCSVQQWSSLQCPKLATAASTTNKPERVSLNDLGAGSYTLVIFNYGPGAESCSYSVTLTR